MEEKMRHDRIRANRQEKEVRKKTLHEFEEAVATTAQESLANWEIAKAAVRCTDIWENFPSFSPETARAFLNEHSTDIDGIKGFHGWLTKVESFYQRVAKALEMGNISEDDARMLMNSVGVIEIDTLLANKPSVDRRRNR